MRVPWSPCAPQNCIVGAPVLFTIVETKGNAVRQVRNDEYMPDNKDQLRRIGPFGEEPASKDLKNDLSKKAAARETVRAVFNTLGR